jgi:hypothetical protein
VLADLRRSGSLAGALWSVLEEEDRAEHRSRRYHSVRERFSWPALLPDYVAMLTQGPPSAVRSPAERRTVTAELAG